MRNGIRASKGRLRSAGAQRPRAQRHGVPLGGIGSSLLWKEARYLYLTLSSQELGPAPRPGYQAASDHP